MSRPTPILTYDALYEHTHRHAFGGNRAGSRDGVGLEVELMAFVAGGERDGCMRAKNADAERVVGWLKTIGAAEGWDLALADEPAPVIALPGRGTITLEPGGQIEYSSAVFGDAVEALDDVDRFIALLSSRADAAGLELRIAGFNSACSIDEIGLQLATPRYRAMDEHFASIGPYGQEMMRATCALQINLDFGDGSIAAERWRLANMIAPAMNALFANSPHVHHGRRFRSYRGEIWRHADPTRTGRLFDRPDLDPVADYLRFALDARVIMIRTGATCVRPTSAQSFREWMEGGSSLGYPDIADWELHLTTLFPDVRARGFMEFRSIDALPSPWRRVAVGLVTTLMYDESVRRAALERLESRPRVRTPGEHEHGGYWRGDLATGRELLAIARPRIDPRLFESTERFDREVAGKGLVPADVR
jgi:glutamate--cysteine ligase